MAGRTVVLGSGVLVLVCAVACGDDGSLSARDSGAAGESHGGEQNVAGDASAGRSDGAGGSQNRGGADTGGAGGSDDVGGSDSLGGRESAGGSDGAGGSDDVGGSDSAGGADNVGGGTDGGGAGGAGAPNTVPSIALTGASVVLDCLEAFVEPGVTATDAEDGALPVTVEGLEQIDTSAPGKFTLTYSAVDAASNLVSVTRDVFVCGPACGDLGREPIDLSSWEVVQYEQPSQGNATWVIADDGLSARQTINADASILLSDFDTADITIAGTWTMQSSSDDDFVGFVYGYQDRGHFYLFDWKGATQTYQGTQALVGMTLKLVNVVEPTSDPIQLGVADLWASVGTVNTTPLSAGDVPLHNSIAWAKNKPYDFELESHAGSFRLVVRDGDTVLTDWSVHDETFSSGKFGFYNFSQAPVLYEGFTRRVTPPDCSAVE